MPESSQRPMHTCAIPNPRVNSLEDVTPAFSFIAPALEDHPPVVRLLLLPALTPLQYCVSVLMARGMPLTSEWDHLQGQAISSLAFHQQ